jgi:hypothetical protein
MNSNNLYFLEDFFQHLIFKILKFFFQIIEIVFFFIYLSVFELSIVVQNNIPIDY